MKTTGVAAVALALSISSSSCWVSVTSRVLDMKRHYLPADRSEYAAQMEQTSAGELVTVAAGGPKLDGIVFDTPSRTKVVVAVVDRAKGPVFRTVHPDTLTERSEAGPQDQALRLLVRRTPAPVRGAGRGGTGGESARAGHTRTAMHRTTGK
jgi:hypothetical protein